jgi:hypothetical protein
MPTAPTWTGWLWVAGAWQRAVTGDSLAQCGKRLAHAARKRGVPDRFSIMTGGGTPSYRPPGEEVNVMRKPLRVKTNRKTPPPIRRPPRPPEPRPPAEPPGPPPAGKP